jgi:hypothetical protein
MPGGYAVGVMVADALVAAAIVLLLLPPVGAELPCIDQLRLGENADAGTCATECTANAYTANGAVYCLPRCDSTRASARSEGWHIDLVHPIPTLLSTLSGTPIDAKRMVGWLWCRAVVIGSAKCGTKEVQLWLGAHPKVRA